MRLSRLSKCVAIGALILPAIASADVARKTVSSKSPASEYDIVLGKQTIDDLQFARQVVPAPAALAAPGPIAAVAQSRVLYLNKNGATLTPGTNDARTNRSTLATQQTTIAPWNVSATTWTATVACVRELFAPFDVTVVDADPGNVPHIEAIFGGSPAQLGMPNGVAGVSPFTRDCSIIENSIVFTFTDVIPANARLACEIQAQEIAHSFGLDHELLASDPMTYLQYNGNRSFQNQAVSCGEDTPRACGIGGSVCRQNQNSVQLLVERLGAKVTPGDTISPVVAITSPSNGATVDPGFTIAFNATDNTAVTMASLFIDGTPSGSTATAPFTFVTADTLAAGQHTLRIVATDGANEKAEEITVTVKGKGTGDGPGDGGGDGNGDGNGNGNGGELTGGCATGGSGASLLLGLGLLGLALARRRR